MYSVHMTGHRLCEVTQYPKIKHVIISNNINTQNSPRAVQYKYVMFCQSNYFFGGGGGGVFNAI